MSSVATASWWFATNGVWKWNSTSVAPSSSEGKISSSSRAAATSAAASALPNWMRGVLPPREFSSMCASTMYARPRIADCGLTISAM